MLEKCVIGIEYIQPSSSLALARMILRACVEIGPSAVDSAIENTTDQGFI